MKTTLEMPDELFRDLKVRAARDGIKLKDLITRYLTFAIKHEFTITDTTVIKTRKQLPVAIPKVANVKLETPKSNKELYQLLDDEDSLKKHLKHD